MARKYHGIIDFEYGTSSALSSAGTSVNKLVATDTQIEFPDEEENPVDLHGNQYAGQLYARFVVKAQDLTAFAAIRANWKAGTAMFFAADLDNAERVYTTNSVKNLEYCRPIAIQGREQGRSDGFEMAFRVPYDDLTFA